MQDQGCDEGDKADRRRAREARAEGVRQLESGYPGKAIEAFGAAADLYQRLAAPTQDDRHNCAAALESRGIAKSEAGDVGGAIADFDASIALREEIQAALDEGWPVPQRIELARALQNRGNAKSYAGDVAGAIADYDSAITLMEAIRDALGEGWPVPLRNDLAQVLQNQGNAKSEAGDVRGAIADLDASIALREEIQIALGEGWPVPLRNDLARTLLTRGITKSDAGDIAGAIADYDASIALMVAIRKVSGEGWSVPLRNGLAGALQNRGNAKSNAGDIAGAIAHLDASIELMEAIRDALGEGWPVPMRNDLARGHVARGYAKRSFGDARQALADHRRAQEFVADLVTGEHGIYFPAVEVYLRNAGALIGLLVEFDEADAATDIADESLALARTLEDAGVLRFRSEREYLFGVALEAYAAAGMLGALPEIVAENLEPDAAGSACDSAQMHEVAAAALQRALTTLDNRADDRVLATRVALQQALDRLAILRKLYFGGTAASASLNAALAVARGDAARAEEIHSAYIERHGADPEGYIARATFFAGQQNTEGALNDYMAAARAIIALADPGEPEDVRRVTTVAEAMLRLDLAVAAGTLAGTSPTDPRFLAEFDHRRDWLVMAFPATVLKGLPEGGLRGAGAWREVLSPALQEVWRTVADPLRQTLLDQSVEAIRRDNDRDWQRRLRQVADGLPMPWQGFVLAIVDAHAEVMAARMEVAAGDPSLDEEIVEAMARRVRDFTLRIAAAELAEAGRIVAASLGVLWEGALTDEERRYLAVALHCARDPAMTGFALLPLGCAVEHVLLDRLIAPLRGTQLPPPVDDDHVGRVLYGHLAQEKRPPELRALIGLYDRALHRVTGHAHPWQGYDALGLQLSRASDLSVLRLDDIATRKRRNAALNGLADQRNRVAHGSSSLPTTQEFAAAWQAMIDDHDDAFFRYFPTAFPAQPARST